MHQLLRETRRGHGRTALAALGVVLLSVVLSGCGGSSGSGSSGGSGGSGSSGGSASATMSRSVSPSTSAGTGAVTVHLDVVHQGPATLAVAPVTIDGRGPFPFIVDTGASTSAIDRTLARQLGLVSTGRMEQVSGVTASQSAPVVSVPHWSVGTFSLPAGSDLGALAFPKSPSGGTIAGLLGSDELSKFGSITLNYRAQQLSFTP